ncbi:MAG: diacylglycerol/lipid kinase family protein [Spirochaetota bacterium]
MERRILVLINARGERTAARRVRRVAHEVLHRAGIEHTVISTRKMSHLRSLAASASDDGYTEIACAGGDGTITMVAQELRDRSLPVSIIPCGTGNVLAKHLGVPLMLRPALEILIGSQRTVALDAIRRPNGLSILNLSTGLSSLTMADVDSGMKRVFGTATYFIGVLAFLVRRNPAQFRVTIDGHDHRIIGREVLVSNAGFRRTAIETFFAASDPTDGVLECSMFIAGGVRGALAMIADVIEGGPRRAERYMIQLPIHNSIRIESDPRLPVQADGDPVGHGTTYATIMRRALVVRAPE